MAKTKWVYFFGGKKAEAGEKLRNLVGGKGAGLADMVNLGIPVPPGFTITTEACVYFYQNNMAFPEGLKEQVIENMKKVERLWAWVLVTKKILCSFLSVPVQGSVCQA